MKTTTLSAGFIPLTDSAPLIIAQEMGYAAEEGIALDLKRAPSWSSLRDMLSFGRVDAAHMLSPVPVASALGLGGAGVPLSAVSVLSVNGNVIRVSNALAEKLRASTSGSTRCPIHTPNEPSAVCVVYQAVNAQPSTRSQQHN